MRIGDNPQSANVVLSDTVRLKKIQWSSDPGEVVIYAQLTSSLCMIIVSPAFAVNCSVYWPLEGTPQWTPKTNLNEFLAVLYVVVHPSLVLVTRSFRMVVKKLADTCGTVLAYESPTTSRKDVRIDLQDSETYLP